MPTPSLKIYNKRKITKNALTHSCDSYTTRNALSKGKIDCKVCDLWNPSQITKVKTITNPFLNLPEEFTNLFPDNSGNFFPDRLNKIWSFTPKLNGDVYLYLAVNFFSGYDADDEKFASIQICDNSTNIQFEYDTSNNVFYTINGSTENKIDITFIDLTANPFYYKYEDFTGGRNIILKNLQKNKTYCITVSTYWDDRDNLNFGGAARETDIGVVLKDKCSNILELSNIETFLTTPPPIPFTHSIFPQNMQPIMSATAGGNTISLLEPEVISTTGNKQLPENFKINNVYINDPITIKNKDNTTTTWKFRPKMGGLVKVYLSCTNRSDDQKITFEFDNDISLNYTENSRASFYDISKNSIEFTYSDNNDIMYKYEDYDSETTNKKYYNISFNIPYNTLKEYTITVHHKAHNLCEDLYIKEQEVGVVLFDSNNNFIKLLNKDRTFDYLCKPETITDENTDLSKEYNTILDTSETYKYDTNGPDKTCTFTPIQDGDIFVYVSLENFRTSSIYFIDIKTETKYEGVVLPERYTVGLCDYTEDNVSDNTTIKCLTIKNTTLPNSDEYFQEKPGSGYNIKLLGMKKGTKYTIKIVTTGGSDTKTSIALMQQIIHTEPKTNKFEYLDICNVWSPPDNLPLIEYSDGNNIPTEFFSLIIEGQSESVWEFSPDVSGDIYVYLAWKPVFTEADNEKITSITLCDNRDNRVVDISGQDVSGVYNLSGTEIIFTDDGSNTINNSTYRYENFGSGRNIILQDLDASRKYCINVSTDNNVLDEDIFLALVDRCSNFLELTQQN